MKKKVGLLCTILENPVNKLNVFPQHAMEAQRGQERYTTIHS